MLPAPPAECWPQSRCGMLYATNTAVRPCFTAPAVAALTSEAGSSPAGQTAMGRSEIRLSASASRSRPARRHSSTWRAAGLSGSTQNVFGGAFEASADGPVAAAPSGRAAPASDRGPRRAARREPEGGESRECRERAEQPVHPAPLGDMTGDMTDE
ncbi:hypothetical protein SALBM135S_07147 [Streptomyces alboniger]